MLSAYSIYNNFRSSTLEKALKASQVERRCSICKCTPAFDARVTYFYFKKRPSTVGSMWI